MNNKRILPITLAFFLIGCGEQQKDNGERATIRVATIQCSMCVETIETSLSDFVGVRKAKVDLTNKIVTIEFDPSRVNVAALETGIAKVGYDANDRKADAEAYEKLPDCCKVGN